MNEMTCFKAYDIRGEIDVNIDSDVAYCIGRAVAQHFGAKAVVVGFDARETSPEFADAVARGVCDAGANVLYLGMAGTEEMYWAVSEFDACAGIVVTASHNPINYNGMKIVKSQSRPLDDLADFQVIKSLAQSQDWVSFAKLGQVHDYSKQARQKYVERVLGFVDVSTLKPMKIVINCGNGAAGPTFDAIAQRLNELGAPLEFIRVHHQPDSHFPNGIPNPMLKEQHSATADVILAHDADMGVAFDGDFDRCFFFDEQGAFVPGEYVVGLLASIFLVTESGARIVHDPRVIWNTQDIVKQNGGQAVQSKTGHAFIKMTMRDHGAVYGGEMSAHHYFRDFAYCDSGMIPWLLVVQLISQSGRSLGNWVQTRFEKFPSSGERNFKVADTEQVIGHILGAYQEGAALDEMDGVSLAFHDWRFNLRKSNTEPLIRLNVETKGSAEALETHLRNITGMIDSFTP